MSEKIIAIGALGGSGTRAVAQIFIKAGLFMGDDLNHANDNLLFTRLFKSPLWYKTSSRDEKILRLNIFRNYMEKHDIDISHHEELFNAITQNETFNSSKMYYADIINSCSSETKEINKTWGWKEPNTHIFLNEILEFFSNVRYIHVLRNGLDMAFSENKQQLHNWGWKYGILLNGNETFDELAVKQLDFWIASTIDIIEKKDRFSNNIIFLNHTNLCKQPKKEIDRLISFLKLDINNIDELYTIPKLTETYERYKHYNLDIFRRDQILFVKKMGFNVN